MKQVLISAIMIVKNEEHRLAPCLESLTDVVDEICLVDTGSTDGTIELAKKFGANINIFPWNGNEADARNVSVQMAKGEWIFLIDADERLSSELRKELRAALEKITADIQSLSFLLRDHYANGSTSLSRIIRIGRNFPGFRFEGKIHPQGSFRPPTLELQSCLDHYGYQWTDEQRNLKSTRMLEMLRPEVEHPSPVLASLCQYLTYALIGNDVQAIDFALKKISAFSEKERAACPYWSQALGNWLYALSLKNDFSIGEKYAHESLAHAPHTIASIVYLLQGTVKEEKWEEVLELSTHLENAYQAPLSAGHLTFPEIHLPISHAWRHLAEIKLEKSTESWSFENIIPLTLPVWLYGMFHQIEELPLLTKNSSLLLRFAQTLHQKNIPPHVCISMEEKLNQYTCNNSTEQLLSDLLLLDLYTRQNKPTAPLMEKMLQQHRNLLWLMKTFEQVISSQLLWPNCFYEAVCHLT